MRVAAAVVLVLVVALPGRGAPPRHASLQLAKRAPLTIVGRGFGEREPVTLTAAAAGAGRSMTVTARRNGRFRARFSWQLTRCSPFVVRAVGARGSRAILQADPGCKGSNRP